MLTSEQKKERLLGIGGSDVAAIAGFSNYKTPVDIYLIKIGETEDSSTNEAAYWGNKLEKEVADEYARKRGVEIFKPETAIVHPKYYWMRCNLDFVVKGTTIVGECKTAGFEDDDEWGEEGSEDIPIPYMLQCAHNAVTSEHLYGTTQVDVPVLFGGWGGHRHKIYTYRRNKRLEDNVIDMGHAFWKEHVEKRIPPIPSVYKEATRLWPEAAEITKTASLEALSTLDTLKDIRNQIKKLQEEEDAKKTEICNYMQDASVLLDLEGEKLATWKNQEANRMDMESFKKSQPELYKEFLKKSKSRVFRVA